MSSRGRVSAYDKVVWRGVELDRITKRALEWAENASGVTISPSQGSYRPATSWSGSTHTGGGSVDIRCVHLSRRDRKRLLHGLKDAGFAAWHRPAGPSWGAHIHALLIGNKALAASARWQVEQYDAGRSGLVSNARDLTYRTKPRVRFSFRQKVPVSR